MVTVKRVGGSLAVIIPRAIAAESGLAEGASLDVSRTAAGILFRHPGRRQRRSTAAIARQLNSASYARRKAELAKDMPVGRDPLLCQQQAIMNDF